MRIILTLLAAVVLSLASLFGGVAVLTAWIAPRRKAAVFAGVYALGWGAMWLAAPLAGRTALPCFGNSLRAQSPFYCVLGRHYVTTDLRDVARDAADQLARAHPGTVLLTLDGGFALTRMPLLPHLSHDDGEKLDFALFYRDASGPVTATRSPIGYFAFEALDAGTCPPAWPTLRWNLRPLQPLWRDLDFDADRTAALIRILKADPRVGKIFVEPPLARQMGVAGGKVRFQGCRAARHDDHIHIQL